MELLLQTGGDIQHTARLTVLNTSDQACNVDILALKPSSL